MWNCGCERGEEILLYAEYLQRAKTFKAAPKDAGELAGNEVSIGKRPDCEQRERGSCKKRKAKGRKRESRYRGRWDLLLPVFLPPFPRELPCLRLHLSRIESIDCSVFDRHSTQQDQYKVYGNVFRIVVAEKDGDL